LEGGADLAEGEGDAGGGRVQHGGDGEGYSEGKEGGCIEPAWERGKIALH
jgi:hypothetical protein